MCLSWSALASQSIGDPEGRWGEEDAHVVWSVPDQERGEGAEDRGAAGDPAPGSVPDRGQPGLGEGPHAAGLPHREGGCQGDRSPSQGASVAGELDPFKEARDLWF